MTTKSKDHECGVDSVPGLGLNGVDGASICYLSGLKAEISEEGLYYRSGNGEGANICADNDAYQTPHVAEKDGKKRNESVDDEACV